MTTFLIFVGSEILVSSIAGTAGCWSRKSESLLRERLDFLISSSQVFGFSFLGEIGVRPDPHADLSRRAVGFLFYFGSTQTRQSQVGHQDSLFTEMYSACEDRVVISVTPVSPQSSRRYSICRLLWRSFSFSSLEVFPAECEFTADLDPSVAGSLLLT